MGGWRWELFYWTFVVWVTADVLQFLWNCEYQVRISLLQVNPSALVLKLSIFKYEKDLLGRCMACVVAYLAFQGEPVGWDIIITIFFILYYFFELVFKVSWNYIYVILTKYLLVALRLTLTLAAYGSMG